jgi:hypothetical protein
VSAAEHAEHDPAAIRVLSGNPSDEELAAVIAVLTAAAAEQPVTAPAEPSAPTEWSRSAKSLRSWTHGATWR